MGKGKGNLEINDTELVPDLLRCQVGKLFSTDNIPALGLFHLFLLTGIKCQQKKDYQEISCFHTTKFTIF